MTHFSCFQIKPYHIKPYYIRYCCVDDVIQQLLCAWSAGHVLGFVDCSFGHACIEAVSEYTREDGMEW
jgi:hypothetical protein